MNRNPIRPIAAAAGLLLALSARAELRTLDFENVYAGAPSCDTCALDSWEGFAGGYAETGLVFNRWMTLDVVDGQLGGGYPSGYPLALNSGKFIVTNYFGNSAELSSATPFSLVSAYMSAAFKDGLTFNVVGWRGGVQVYSDEVVLNTEERVLVRFSNHDVDFVEFRMDFDQGETNPFLAGSSFNWAMDDLKVNISPVPEPASWGLLAGGLAWLASRRRFLLEQGPTA
jgi:hypothetical protein